MTAQNIRMFDKTGREVAEIEAATKRSWVSTEKDSEGDCVWTMSTNDVKAKEDFIQFGNLILIQETNIPDWVGVIDLDPATQPWGYSSFDVTAYSAERLLKYGDTPITTINGTTGANLKQLLDFYNQETDLPLQQGDIFLGGPTRQESLGDSVFAHLQRLVRGANYDWNITPLVEGGRLKLYVNLYETRGYDTKRMLFEGGHGSNPNIEAVNPILEKAGPIWNIIHGYTDASSGGKRLDVIRRDETSRNTYGPRRKSLVFSGVTDLASLTAYTEAYLKQYAYPLNQLQLKVLNVNNIYSTLDIGNIHAASLTEENFTNGGFGLEAKSQIFSMERDDKIDRMSLGVKVIS